MTLMVLGSKNLESGRVRHGFFARDGGVSEGIYAGLNCGQGSRDNAEHVQENRRRVAQHFSTTPDRLCTLYQVHSPDVALVHEPTQGTIQADAMVTTRHGLVLGILTADCAPVLLADEQAGVIAAAHAGWKGAYGGVLEHTVQAMLKAGAVRSRIVAAIGPCIAQASYEVGPELIQALKKQDPGNVEFFRPNTKRGHAQFDLEGYVAKQLRGAGLRTITPLAMDTYSNEPQFFSYRRTTHRGELDYGRQISCIMLRDRRAAPTIPYRGEERRI
jgi:YfiH family protein